MVFEDNCESIVEFYIDIMAYVRLRIDVSEWFPVTLWVISS